MVYYDEMEVLCMFQIMVVEDDKETNEAISEYLRELGYGVLSAFDGEEALELFSENLVDVIVLDIMLPKIPGISVLHKIREKSNTPVLMLTAISDEYTQITSFDEKVDDYMTKPFSMVLLGKRVEALLRRSNVCMNLDVMRFSDITVDFSGYSATAPWGKIDITPKEIQLLKFFVQHRGMVFTRNQILNAVWGEDSYVIDRTIDTYVRNLRKKLLLSDIVTVKGIGYKYEVAE